MEWTLWFDVPGTSWWLGILQARGENLGSNKTSQAAVGDRRIDASKMDASRAWPRTFNIILLRFVLDI